MYRRIVVPVDGSPAGARGLREAIRLAKNQDAQLRIIHVVDEMALASAAEAGVNVQPLLARLGKAGGALLRRAARRAAQAGVRAETVICETAGSSAANAILRDAAQSRADVIVMGTHGRRGLRRAVLGSDAEQVVRRSAVPVLLVRAQ